MLLMGNPRFRTLVSDDGGVLVSLFLMRASYLEQLLDGGGKR
jgi:hypothetical protein